MCVFDVVLTTSTDCFPKEFCPINLSDEHGLSAPRSENWSCCEFTSSINAPSWWPGCVWGCQLPDSHGQGLGFCAGPGTWGLRWTEWHRDGIFFEYFQSLSCLSVLFYQCSTLIFIWILWLWGGRVDDSENFNPLNPELNPICYLLALLGAHHFLHVCRIRVKLLTFRRLMSCIYGAPILDVSRSHTTTQHSR